VAVSTYSPSYDLKHAVSANQFVGLWRMMTGFRLAYLGAMVTLGLASISKTTTLLLLRDFVDNMLGKPGTTSGMLLLVALGFIVLAVFEGAFTFWSGRLAARTAEGVTVRLRNYLFDHVQRLAFSYFDKTQTGDLIQRSTSDVDAVRRFFADQAIGLGRIFILFGINFIVLLSLDWQLALASVLVVPFIAVLSVFFFKQISQRYEAFQEQDAVLSTVLQENLTGVRVVKAFARQNYERDKFEKANQDRFRRGKKLLLTHAVYWPLTDTICGIQVGLGYLFGSFLVVDGQITLGSYMAYVGLIWWVINPLRNLGRIIANISTGAVSYKRVIEMIKEEQEPLTEGTHRPADHVRGEIVFENVDFQYAHDAPVLHNINFRCQPGDVVALLGSTGSGKTTLVNLLPRFYEYSSGRVTLDGVDLKEYPRDYLRRQIGIVEQEPFLFSRSIRENITYGTGHDVTDAEIEAAARAAAIHDVILSFPEGYGTLVGEKGVTLSGGQKQRVAVARTLLKNPRILILDDATSSVDTETETAIRLALQNLMNGRTSFVIAHRIQSVMSADLILVLDQGRIVQQGAHDELMAQPGIYRRIYDVQTRIELELEKEIARA
jgi:ATP-binding cassette subfamily B protein